MRQYVPLHRKGNTVVTMNGGEVLRHRADQPTVGPITAQTSITVKLYQTIIVEVHEGKLTLDTGGYDTVTTRARMNQFLRDYLGSPFFVRVTKGQLNLVPRGHNAGIPFDRRITVDLTN